MRAAERMRNMGDESGETRDEGREMKDGRVEMGGGESYG